jgi:hypothetical protein
MTRATKSVFPPGAKEPDWPGRERLGLSGKWNGPKEHCSQRCAAQQDRDQHVHDL